MDLNDLRIIITSLSFVVFGGIVYWAYSGRQRARFNEAANLPFLDSDLPGESTVAATENRSGDRP
jgi:cytochrome c oxidase cbb3-type subunit 4